MRKMRFLYYCAHFSFISSVLCCIFFAISIGNVNNTHFNGLLFNLAISFVIVFASYRSYRYLRLRYCVVCGLDLENNLDIRDGKPIIPAVNPQGKIIGAACLRCLRVQHLRDKPERNEYTDE